MPVVAGVATGGAHGWLGVPTELGAAGVPTDGAVLVDGGAGRLAISTGTVAEVGIYVDVRPGRYCPGAYASFTADPVGAAFVVGIAVAVAGGAVAASGVLAEDAVVDGDEAVAVGSVGIRGFA